MYEETCKVMDIHVPQYEYTFKLYITLCGLKNSPAEFTKYLARSLRYTCNYNYTFKLFETRNAFFIYQRGKIIKTFALFEVANAWIVDKCVSYMEAKFLGNLGKHFENLPATLNYIH